MIAQKLDAEIKVVCPILGVSIGRRDDKSTWRIEFAEEATLGQRHAAQAVLDAFEPGDYAYIEKRLQEYPPIGDQLDALWKGGVEMAEMQARVMAIKAKYPKPR